MLNISTKSLASIDSHLSSREYDISYLSLCQCMSMSTAASLNGVTSQCFLDYIKSLHLFLFPSPQQKGSTCEDVLHT